MALKKYRVIGLLPIRDAVTKESAMTREYARLKERDWTTDIVTLDDAPIVRKDGREWAATRVDALIEAGLIEPYVEVTVGETGPEPVRLAGGKAKKVAA